MQIRRLLFYEIVEYNLFLQINKKKAVYALAFDLNTYPGNYRGNFSVGYPKGISLHRCHFPAYLRLVRIVGIQSFVVALKSRFFYTD